MGAGFCSLYHKIHYIEVRYIECTIKDIRDVMNNVEERVCVSHDAFDLKLCDQRRENY